MKEVGDWVAYVGPFMFPWGQAGSRRVLGVALSIAESGRRVVVVSGESSPSSALLVETSPSGGKIEHVGVGELPSKNSSKATKAFQIYVAWGRETLRWLEAQETRPSHVVVYGGASQYMTRLLPWCHRNKVSLIADVVEWYNPKQLTGGFWGPSHASAKYALIHQYKKCDGIIAISKFLTDYYRKQDKIVATVPPTVDVRNLNLDQRLDSTSQRLGVLYFGTPGKKDALASIVRAAEPFESSMELTIAGPNQLELSHALGGRTTPRNVIPIGKIDQSDMSRIVQSADFTILVRENARFTKAGFPTKFVESMANGVPVICNLTSDLASHVIDGGDAIVCHDESETAIQQAIDRAVKMSDVDLAKMRTAARSRAESDFDYRRFTEPLATLLEQTGQL